MQEELHKTTQTTLSAEERAAQMDRLLTEEEERCAQLQRELEKIREKQVRWQHWWWVT